MNRWIAALLLTAIVGVVAGAAEPIKLDLSLFKLTPAAKIPDELLKNENDMLSFYASGSAAGKLTVPADGEYVIVIEASCTAALKENAKFTLKVGDKVIKEKFELTTEDQKEYKFDAKLTKGDTTLDISYTNDAYKENEYDRNLFIHAVRVEKK